MRRYLIVSVVILMALAVAWSAFGQGQGQGSGQGQQGQRGQRMGQALSEEERAKLRERWQNMSEEERQQLRAQMRERFGARRPRMSSEEQLKAIQTIEEQLVKFKEGIKAQTRPEGFQDLSDEERTKLREQMRTARQQQQTALRTIIAQIAMLQGRRQPTPEGEEFIIINTSQLKAIQELAVKEKAKETSDRLASLLEPPRRGGRSRQGQMRQPDQQGQPSEGRNRQRQQQGAGTQGGDV